MKANRVAAMSSRVALVTTFVAVAALILACGSSKPSESESAGKAFLENLGRRGHETQRFKVNSFRKTNGLEQGDNYILEYEAEIECTAVSSSPYILYGAPMLVACERVGQINKVSGRMAFGKTEKGWRAGDGNIY